MLLQTQNSSVSVRATFWARKQGVWFQQANELVLLPKRPAWLSRIFNGFRMSFPLGQSNRSLKVRVQVYLFPKLRRTGPIPQLLYTPVMAHK